MMRDSTSAANREPLSFPLDVQPWITRDENAIAAIAMPVERIARPGALLPWPWPGSANPIQNRAQSVAADCTTSNKISHQSGVSSELSTFETKKYASRNTVYA